MKNVRDRVADGVIAKRQIRGNFLIRLGPPQPIGPPVVPEAIIFPGGRSRDGDRNSLPDIRV